MGKEISGERDICVTGKLSGGVPCRTEAEALEAIIQLNSQSSRGHVMAFNHQKQTVCNYCNERQG